MKKPKITITKLINKAKKYRSRSSIQFPSFEQVRIELLKEAAKLLSDKDDELNDEFFELIKLDGYLETEGIERGLDLEYLHLEDQYFENLRKLKRLRVLFDKENDHPWINYKATLF